jgi:integrative and conjugative element protein (TIGR02256 family)
MQTMVIFIRKEGAMVKIDCTPLAVMKKYRQVEDRDKEAGGILLGRMIENSDDVIVDEITVPGMFDRRNRFSFFRSKFIQKFINIKWRASLHTKNYLGEWHTHPEPYPSPSGKDLRNWQTIMNKGTFDQDFLIFVIVGQLTISAWELRKNDKIPHQLQQIN